MDEYARDRRPAGQATRISAPAPDESAGIRQVPEQARLADEKTQADINAETTETALRLLYANRILRFLEIYGLVVATFTALSGFGLWGFKMQSQTLITLVGSTAVAAIGLAGFIVKGLFSRPL